MSFLGRIYEYARQLVTLKDLAEKNQREIEELRSEVRDITNAVRHLGYQIKLLEEREGHERKQLSLELENRLLRFEKRLPPGDA